MKIPRTALISTIAALLGVVVLIWALRGHLAQPGKPDELTLGTPVIDNTALIYVAHERGFFRDQGLKVTLKDYTAGVLAAAALTKGEVDVAAASEFVFVNHVLNKENVSTFGAIAATNNVELVARKDHGVARPADLKGKKIGLLFGTGADFFFGSFLAFNDLPLSAVHSVNLPVGEMAEALSQGTVDAVVSFGQYAFETKKRLGANGVSWPIQLDQDYYFLLICKDEFTKARPETVKKLLRALIKAEEFAKDHPADARAILQKRLGVGPDVADAMWSQNRFGVRLPQNLLLLMDDETRWLQGRGGRRTDAPNYLPNVYRPGLDAVKPEAVGIIH